MSFRIHRGPPQTAAQRGADSALAEELPRLPAGPSATLPRRLVGPTWMAPGRAVLTRHRALDGRDRLLSLDREAPPGFAFEHDLGQVHVHALPGTSRLLASAEEIRVTRVDGALADDYCALGHVEDAPLPLLDALHLARVHGTGQLTCVCGAADPLLGQVDLIGRLGFLDGYPLQPQVAQDLRGDDWGAALLVRIAEPHRWRHAYTTVAGDPPAGAVALGRLWQREAAPGMATLHLAADGRVSSTRLSPAGRARTAAATTRWIGAPLAWSRPHPRAWAVRATASRARAVATRAATRRSSATPRVLGHLYADPGPHRTPLFSATHPALADQLLTRSDLEARDLGYVVDGILGYVGRAAGHARLQELPHEIRWGSRFGHGRRYVEPQPTMEP